MPENEVNDTPEPMDGLGMQLNPMLSFYQWAAENKTIRRHTNGKIEGDVPEAMKWNWPNINNKNVAMSNLNHKDEQIIILSQMINKMTERILTKKTDITAERLVAEERNDSDFRLRLTQGRNGFFMKQMTTSTNIIMNNNQPQAQQPEQPRPRWI